MVASPMVAPRLAAQRAVYARAPLDLEARLVAQVRAPVALRRALARVAGRMVATCGWERLGSARSGDYAVERVGISGRELRDLAAVDRALTELPALDAAFCAGEIGWTQLRLLCRVATVEDQEEWLALAERLTARELAREVRAVDRRAREPLDAESDDEERVSVVLRLTPRARARWWSARQVANRAAGHPLSHGMFAEVLAAEVLSGVPLADQANPSLRRAGGAVGGSRHAAVRTVARSAMAGSLRSPALQELDAEVAALEHDLASADAFELDRRLRLAVQMEARGQARVVSLLSDVVAWGLCRSIGFRSVDRYVEERLGMAPSRARALLRIACAARVCAPLRVAFAEGHLSWVRAHILVPLLLEPGAARHREGWLAHAQRVTVRRLGEDVERALALGAFAPPPLASSVEETDSDSDPAGLQTGALSHFQKESERLFFRTHPEVAQLFRAVLVTVQRRIEQVRGRPCPQSDALEAMLDHALATWRPKKRTRRDYLVFERDGWRCTVPGCSSYRNLHRHHIVFRSHQGSGKHSNLTTLCAWHHQRGVHGHVLRCTGVAADGLRFELGLRRDAPPIVAYGPGEVLMV